MLSFCSLCTFCWVVFYSILSKFTHPQRLGWLVNLQITITKKLGTWKSWYPRTHSSSRYPNQCPDGKTIQWPIWNQTAQKQFNNWSETKLLWYCFVMQNVFILDLALPRTIIEPCLSICRNKFSFPESSYWWISEWLCCNFGNIWNVWWLYTRLESSYLEYSFLCSLIGKLSLHMALQFGLHGGRARLTLALVWPNLGWKWADLYAWGRGLGIYLSGGQLTGSTHYFQAFWLDPFWLLGPIKLGWAWTGFASTAWSMCNPACIALDNVDYFLFQESNSVSIT